jgi:nucleotide-binding universal stress UspA family protein
LLAIASTNQPEIHFVRITEPTDMTANLRMVDQVDWQIRKAEAESYLSAITDLLQDSDLLMSTELIDGRPAEQIIKVAQDWNADLILMSSHGRSGLSPWSVSSVVEQVILLARCSVMIVRAFQPAIADIHGLHYRKIFLPLDGSKRAEMPLSFAETLMRTNQRKSGAYRTTTSAASPDNRFTGRHIPGQTVDQAQPGRSDSVPARS